LRQNNPSVVLLGVDPGTALTGYGFVLEEPSGELKALDYGVIKTADKTALEKRLQIIYTELTRLIQLHRPVSGAVEKLFFQSNAKTALSVGQARGVILLALANCGVQVASYTPMQVKQAVSGYGGADKNQVQQMIRMMLSLEDIPRPDDAADALAVAICHSHSRRLTMLENGETE
jgi:crossover junction endodeoxyribonuclease RuvC